MRKYAILKDPVNDIKKVLLYESTDGVDLFMYDTTNDIPCFTDYNFDTLEEVLQICFEEYNIKHSDWININEPMKDCQHDIISPIRVKGRNLGIPQWGKFEKLVNDEWIEFKFNHK
ncbi:hypothetical protein [Faecalimicrobium dakarense]|uniref:hypothetical protein n=1 Tax=Faecalimicrobium dakarense TaxID=1301100 RepID=UPI0004B22D4F|nr:hypothetical protein [[Clostridium] dakarense]